MLSEILLISILLLGIVLVLEIREYRKVTKLSLQLKTLIDSYVSAFASITDIIISFEARFSNSISEHKDIHEDIATLKAIVDIHNKALHLDPSLMEITKKSSNT